MTASRVDEGRVRCIALDHPSVMAGAAAKKHGGAKAARLALSVI